MGFKDYNTLRRLLAQSLKHTGSPVKRCLLLSLFLWRPLIMSANTDSFFYLAHQTRLYTHWDKDPCV